MLDPSGNDWIDFRFADPLPSNAANRAGIVFDMDLVGFDDRSNGDLTFDPALSEVEYLQDVFGVNGTSQVSLMGISDYLQEPPIDSPFENIVGSQLDDMIEIDPLTSVIREVDGNDGWEPLAFDGGGSVVIDSGRLVPADPPGRPDDSYQGSLTAQGIGSIVYANVELVEVFNAAAADHRQRRSGLQRRRQLGPRPRRRVPGRRPVRARPATAATWRPGPSRASHPAGTAWRPPGPPGATGPATPSSRCSTGRRRRG